METINGIDVLMFAMGFALGGIVLAWITALDWRKRLMEELAEQEAYWQWKTHRIAEEIAEEAVRVVEDYVRMRQIDEERSLL